MGYKHTHLHATARLLETPLLQLGLPLSVLGVYHQAPQNRAEQRELCDKMRVALQVEARAHLPEVLVQPHAQPYEAFAQP